MIFTAPSCIPSRYSIPCTHDTFVLSRVFVLGGALGKILGSRVRFYYSGRFVVGCHFYSVFGILNSNRVYSLHF
jgi:hypothetical protein